MYFINFTQQIYTLQIIHLYNGHMYTSAHRWISGSLVSLLNKVRNTVPTISVIILEITVTCDHTDHQTNTQVVSIWDHTDLQTNTQVVST